MKDVSNTKPGKGKAMDRRKFLASAAVGAGVLILPKSVFGANEKLNVLMVGTWGRANAHYRVLNGENIVALCDIDEKKMGMAAKKHPKAKTYVDWRKALEQKDINAVVCCTTDFTHAHVATWSMNRGHHVYCEKPLGNTVEEARTVRAKYLERKDKIATQVGTQRHAMENFNRCRELVQDKAIGELSSVYAWGNRKIPKPGYLPAKGDPPAHLHYDLWLGPTLANHPYNPEYFSGGSGANCLKWNMYWDFGSGQIGDMGSHTIDLAYAPLDADVPTSAEALEGDKFNPDVTPVKLHTRFDIPANDWRPAIKLNWYQGGAMPRSPSKWVDLNRIGHGAMWKGDKGFLIADFRARLLIPFGDKGDMTYYKPRTKETLIPPLGGFQQEWINAAKGNLKTTCNFDYGGKIIETMLLGLVAYRVGLKTKISYDGKAGKTGNPKADALLSKKYRDGWPLDG